MLRKLRQEMQCYLADSGNKSENNSGNKSGNQSVINLENNKRRPLLVVAFSGGRDSVALLAALHELSQELNREADGLNFDLVAAHFNHCLRGAEADEDQEFCRDFCAGRGMEFRTVRRDVRTLAGGENIENAARKLRYEWLYKVCDEYREARGGSVWLVTAHHRDDQAETVLLHMLRGGGSGGLSAMRQKNGDLLRPLLGVDRSEIEAYLAERGLGWREDSTNACQDMTRNYLRHEVMPRLRRVNPRIGAALSQTAAVLGAEDEFLSGIVAEKMAAAELSDGRAEYPWEQLAAEHIAVQRRLVRWLWCHVAASEVCSMTFEQVESVLRLKPGKAVHTARGIEVKLSARSSAKGSGKKDGRRLVLRRFDKEERERRAAKSRSGQSLRDEESGIKSWT